MHKHHDLDLIADFAAGRLDDPESAQAMVATCPDCSRAYHNHRTVLEAVSRQSPAVLNDLERHQVRMAVWEALGPEPSRAVSASRTPWWYRVSAVAAALVVVVGVGATLLGGRGGGTATMAGEALTTTADAVEAPADTFAAASGGAADTPAGPEADSGLSEETSTADEFSDRSARLYIPAGEMAVAATEFERRAPLTTDPISGVARDCARVDPTSPPAEVMATQPADIDDTPAWLVAFGSGSEVTGVRFYAEATCEVLYKEE